MRLEKQELTDLINSVLVVHTAHRQGILPKSINYDYDRFFNLAINLKIELGDLKKRSGQKRL